MTRSERPPHQLESTQRLLDWEEAWLWHRLGASEAEDDSSVAFCDHELGLIRRELGRREKLRHLPGAPVWPERPKMALRARFQCVKDSIPIAQWLEANGGLLRRSDGRGVTKACCPLPDHWDDTPSFTIYGDIRWHCYGCHRSGDIFDLAMALWGYTQPYEVLRLLEQTLGIEEPKEREPNRPVVTIPVVKMPDGSLREIRVS